MSRDYGYVFIDNNLELVRYHDPPTNATEQHMRLITGSLTKYLMGIWWHAGGYSIDEVNEQWDWGADWTYNQSTGHAPDETLLLLGRWPPTLMLAAGVLVIFAIGMELGNHRLAYFASLFYALHPGLLLNGRRAMFEGGLILLSLLTVMMAIRLLRDRDWRSALLLGMVSGLAVSAKHPAAFTVIAVFAGCAISGLAAVSKRFGDLGVVKKWVATGNGNPGSSLLLQLTLAGLLALLVFYLVNPVWWGNPIERAEQVFEARKGILDGQVAAFGGYDNIVDQLGGFARQVVKGAPQYYEADTWAGYIADQIDRYEASPWRGFSLGESIPGGLVLSLVTLVGLWSLSNGKNKPTPAQWIVGVWALVIFLSSAILTPLEWQRYYLMTYPLVGLLAGAGLMWLLEPVPVAPPKRVRIDSL